MGDSEPQPHIATLVGRLIEAPKELVGTPQWRPGNRDSEWRFEWPVLVNGEGVECSVCATCYPEWPELRFTITLNYRRRNVWRVDHEPMSRVEINPLEPNHPLSGMRVAGPHYHSWEDNRRDATAATVPETLRWRQPLRDGPNGWESTFRWFCGQTNIAQPSPGGVPDLMKKQTLV